jgi:hypothetical protein
MLFMVIETFPAGNPLPAYRHLRDKGRGLPDGLEYIDSWITADFRRCYQLMRTTDASLLQQWVLHWQDAGMAFEIVPVVHSSDTRETVAPFLDRGPA